jgi:hypothetical protein
MLDGLVTIVPKFETKRKPIYTRHERMLDVEKLSLYYPDAQVWTVLTYFDPRRDQEHKNPLRTYLHSVCTQFQNFLFSQLSLEEIEQREIDLLTEFMEMLPSTLCFDFVLGWWDTQAWRSVFPFFTETHHSPNIADVEGVTVEADDLVYIRRKVKIAKYPWNGLDLKFYRLNMENPDHKAKYPRGWDGYSKAEIVTPKFGDIYSPLPGSDYLTIFHILGNLQALRQKLLGEKWQEIQHEVTQKTYARSSLINVWSSTEGPLAGALERMETELTQRTKMQPKQYLERLQKA